MNEKELFSALLEKDIVCMEGTPKDARFVDTDKVKFKLSTLSVFAPYSIYTNDKRLYDLVCSGRMKHTAHADGRYLKETMSRYRISIYNLEDIIVSFNNLTIL